MENQGRKSANVVVVMAPMGYPGFGFPTLTAMPQVGTKAASQEEVNEVMQVHWTTSYARMKRWAEEVDLLHEEMHRVVTFLQWKGEDWLAKMDVGLVTTPPSCHKKSSLVFFKLLFSQVSLHWLTYCEVIAILTTLISSISFQENHTRHRTRHKNSMCYTTATQNPVAKNSGTPLFLLQITKDIQPQRAQNCLTLILGQADL